MLILIRALASQPTALAVACFGALLMSFSFVTCLGDCEDEDDEEEEEEIDGDPCEGGVGCEKIP